MTCLSRSGKGDAFSLTAPPIARRRWAGNRRRGVVLAGLLLLLFTAPVLRWVWFSLFFDARPSAYLSLAPAVHTNLFPFRDLCDAAKAAAANRELKPHRRSSAEVAAQAQRVQRTMQRLEHLPADGGKAGERWSAVTGLPLPADRHGREIKARFVTLSTHPNDVLSASAAAATMAGVSLEVIGLGWTWFSFARRMEIVRSFLDQAGVADDDVVVSIDADALLSGEDVYDALTAFVASTAATAAEHDTFRVRDIRLGRRQPPVLFSAEYNCMHAQAYPSRRLCPTGYDTVDAMMYSWAQRAGVPLPSEHRQVNPFRYLNAGVVVARAWALRRVWAAANAFMASHKFYMGDEWWCDQSVLASLYLQLRWWELRSGALDLTTPQVLDQKAKEACLFAPLVQPDPRRGPHGLPGGLIGLDHVGRFSVVISMQVERKSVLHIGGTPTTPMMSPHAALTIFLNTNGRKGETEGILNISRSRHHLELVPRPGFDCAGGDGANDALGEKEVHASRRPECVYRYAVLGLPNAADVVSPLIWHFAGKYKRIVLTRFRTIFPWYTPMLWNASARSAVLDVLSAAPPTRLWYLNVSTDLPFDNVVHALYPHRSVDDVSFEELCDLSRVGPSASKGAG